MAIHFLSEFSFLIHKQYISVKNSFEDESNWKNRYSTHHKYPHTIQINYRTSVIGTSKHKELTPCTKANDTPCVSPISRVHRKKINAGMVVETIWFC